MAEEIKSLIEKIQQDGIKAAEEKAREIEDQAKKEADLILKNARVETERLLSGAKDNLAKMEQSQKALLAQAGRDFMLGLKEEVKKGIVLKPSEEVRTGFLISFDNAKSYFDFSDQALSEYIGAYLKPKLAELLLNSLKGK